MWIYEDEAYPVYGIDDEEGSGRPLGDALTADELAEYEKVVEAYDAWQERLGAIYKSFSDPAESASQP